MPKFRKKPVEIEAVQFLIEDASTAVAFCGGLFSSFGGDSCIEIRTLEGTMRADVGDWIIRGVKGEHYPCKPDVFAETYEPVD